MSQLDDFNFDRPVDALPVRLRESQRTGVGLAAATLAVIIGGAAAYWIFFHGRTAPLQPKPAPAPVAETSASAGPAPTGRSTLPALEASDALVRSLVAGLSSHPRLAAWLATDNLVRTFVVAVDNVADGTTPAKHLRVLAPSERFQATSQGARFAIDPRSYARYDALADAVVSLDVEGTAKVYQTLRPLMGEAYAEIGRPAARFDDALASAIAALLAVPVIDGGVALTPRGGLFAFADPALEALSPAQKQLLRMGPGNVQRIQAKLKRLSMALGLPVVEASKR